MFQWTKSAKWDAPPDFLGGEADSVTPDPHKWLYLPASDDFEMLAPVELSIFCFRARPPGFTGDLDALNQRILVALQRGGSSYLSNARIQGRFALRGCVLNYRNRRQDMERLLEDLRGAV